ncbi:MAG: ABC-F family ATP-binding cassette domain-containing protein [Candidatus Moranbacteria bacterium]|nr:ABC-F family ATP-binding cassette domain-containing protein [Candidatus Moranbacteria bacterium]
MAKENIVLRFENVSFEYGHKKPILDEVSFSVRSGMKVTLMGQNGAGKSSLFKLITGETQPQHGHISIDSLATVAIARQVIPRDELDFSVKEFFVKHFSGKEWELEMNIREVLEIVNMPMPPLEKKIREFSGGQQARLLLASALIQDPDILLLDEPTNNLDYAGIEHLTQFLVNYEKTVLVISHDAEFLNAFTHGVLYLDVFTHKIEQYAGDYYDVVEEIKRRIEKEQSENVRLERTIREKKDQSNVFANKGGKLRAVAKRMRDLAEELEENKVDIRREDKTLSPFTIECEDIIGRIVRIKTVSLVTSLGPAIKHVDLDLKRNTHLLVSGPNGIGKSTFLEALARGDEERVTIAPGVKVGYYRQDFSTLDFHKTVAETLLPVTSDGSMETVYRTTARFLLPAELVQNKIESLSEGQKGLLMFAYLFLQKPELLILDEPTNHINFRHLPVIAEALDKYKGTMIFVSHVPGFVADIRIDEVLDLESLV